MALKVELLLYIFHVNMTKIVHCIGYGDGQAGGFIRGMGTVPFQYHYNIAAITMT